METNNDTKRLKRVLLTKFRAAVTFLVYSAFLAAALLGLTASFAEAAVPARAPNLNMPLAQQIVSQVYDDTRAKGVVAGYEVAGPRDRIEHMCVDECACISKLFTGELRRRGFTTKTVLLRPAKGSMGITMRGPPRDYGIFKNPSYDYHVVTAVRLLGGWRVVDPVVLQTAKLESFKDWQHRIASPVDMSIR